MNEQRSFAIQSLLIILILNGLLLAGVYVLAGDSLATNGQNLIFWAGGAALTLVLWLLIAWIGRRQMSRAAEVRPAPVIQEPAPAVETPPTPAAPPVAPAPTQSPVSAAVQMLSILQRHGRLIDFLQEDLSRYEDAQIGAAVRNVHAGCRQALDEHVELEPIFAEGEGSPVSVPAGFDAYAIRLSGNVVGDPPFSGTLRHRGWRATQVDLPDQTRNEESSMVIAAAEVEIGV